MRFNHIGVIGEIDSLPGCSQVCVMHSAFVMPARRRKGDGKQAHHMRLEEARKLGYQLAICTVDATNKPQIKILAKHGWFETVRFLSHKTNHLVIVFVKHLQ